MEISTSFKSYMQLKSYFNFSEVKVWTKKDLHSAAMSMGQEIK